MSKATPTRSTNQRGNTINAIAPDHYKTESGLQVWDVTRYMSGNMAQAFQYIYRAGHKESEVEDLRKAAAFLNDWKKNNDAPVMGNLYRNLEQHEAPLRDLLCSAEEWKRPILNAIWYMDYFGDAIYGEEARLYAYPRMMETLKSRITVLERGAGGEPH